jgi:putative Mg2+ transporter-C (MgtC) family protein
MTPGAIDAMDQAIRSWGSHLNWPAEQMLRLAVAAVAGGLVGLEREVRGRQAGFRTNLLVAVGSALVMIISISFANGPWPHDANQFTIRIDPARIAYSIMTGIGFLGAGVIVKHGATVHGLTTAAGLWCVAAVGMAAGFGLYTLTGIATVMIVLALWLLDYFEGILPKLRYRIVVIRRRWEPGCIEQTILRLRETAGVEVTDASFQRGGSSDAVDVSVRIAFTDKTRLYAMQRSLETDAQ